MNWKFSTLERWLRPRTVRAGWSPRRRPRPSKPRRNYRPEIDCMLEERILLTTVQFTNPLFQVAENGTTTSITVGLDAAASTPVAVDYATTTGGSATDGTDYTSTSGTLTFQPGETSQTFTVAILDDGAIDGTETVNLQLSNASNADLGSQSTATLNIWDTHFNSLPGAQTATEDTPFYFSNANGNAMSVTDVAAGGNAIQITLGVDAGALTLSTTSGLTFASGSNGSGSMTVQGTSSDLNEALDGLRFDPATDAGGSMATFTITTDDLGNNGLGTSLTDTGTVPISVNDQPLTPISQSVTATEGVAFTGLVASFTDTDTQATAGDYTATITWDDGTTSSGTITANNQGGFDVSGTHTWPQEGGPYAISIFISEDDGAGSSFTTVSSSASIGDLAPSVAADNSSVSVPENQTPSNTGTFSDYDDAVSLTVDQGTVTDNGNGTWSWTGPGGDETSGYTVTVTATNTDGATATTSFAGRGKTGHSGLLRGKRALCASVRMGK